MTWTSLIAALLAAVPASAQPRLTAVVKRAPMVMVSPTVVLSPQARLLTGPDLTAPTLALPQQLITPSVAPTVTPAVTFPQKMVLLQTGVQGITETLANTPAPSADMAHGAGLQLETLLTGAHDFAAPADVPVSAEELSFAAGASQGLAARADELSAQKGLKAKTMTGAQFLALLDEAHETAVPAATPAAAEAAKTVEASIIRVMRALIAPEKPFAESMSRAFAVWQVFDQELAIAAQKGTLTAITDDATLFASQVEASVEDPRKPSDKPDPAVRPEDPEGYQKMSEPGSVFGWQPIETSPDHGFPALDRLIRRVLGKEKNPYAKGFEFAGAAERSEAKIFVYGERHTDGGLIAANMARLVSDLRPKGKAIILVEGYTGWSLRGHEAVEYLAKRGLDPEALKAKGIAFGDIEVTSWEDKEHYDASQHPLLQHHMDLLELNRLAHSEGRGWRYYRDFAKAALAAWRSRRVLWQASMVVRNGDLEKAVAAAAAEADKLGATVHVIAGTDHLMQNPRLAGLPVIGRLTLRRALKRAFGGRPYWVSQQSATID